MKPGVPESVFEKLRKIKALADGGVGGEAENARASLEKMLRKHGLSFEDLLTVATRRYHFSCKRVNEKRLFCQVAVSVLQSREVKIFDLKVNGRTTNKVAIDLTPAQYLDVEAAFNYYKEALRKEEERLFQAFIHRHDLFPPSDGREPTAKMSKDELAKLMAMIQGLGESSFQKPLAMIEDRRSE